MFGVSIPELLLIFVIALIIFGPEKLPEIASSLGKTFASIRKNTDLLRREFYNSIYTPAEDFRNTIDKAKRELTTLTPELEEKLSAPDPDCPDSPSLDDPASSDTPDETAKEPEEMDNEPNT